MSRVAINKKFEGVSHKWVKIPLSSPVVSSINKSIVTSINNSDVNKEDVLNLFKAFKSKGYIWAKYKNTVGRSNLTCNCILQTIDNKKISFTLNPAELISFQNMQGTPKSLKLYNTKKKEIIVDPKDGFDDGIYPPAWMEFTPEAYEEYKIEWYEKQRKLGLIK